MPGLFSQYEKKKTSTKKSGGLFSQFKEEPKAEVKKETPKLQPKKLNVDTSRPSMVSGGRPMINFDQNKLDKASETAGSFTASLLDSATLGLATKGLNKIEKDMGDKELAKASEGHKVASTIGNLAGYTVPFGIAGKVTKPLTKGITNKLLKTAVTGGIEGAIVGGAQGGINGENVVKSAGQMAALGMGGNLAIAGAGKLIGKVLKPRVFETPKIEPKKLARSTKLTGKLPSKVNTPIAQETSSMASSEINNATAVKPKQVTSKFYSNSLMEGDVLTKEGKKALDETQYIYNVKHNEDSLKRATDLLNANGVEKEVNRLMSSGLNSAEDSMTHYLVTKELMNQAKISGDYSKLNSFLETTRPSITNAGQTIQALSQFKKTTPEGAVMTARKVVDNVVDAVKNDNPNAFKKAIDAINKLPKDANFEAAKNEILKKNGIPTLSNEEIKTIVDGMEKAQTLQGRAKDIEIAKVMQLIGDKVPVNLAEKVKALQRISLLLNTKTMGRNVIGNTILGTLENAKDVVGTPLDILVSKATGQRSTMLPNLLTQAKGLKKGFTQTLEDAKLGIDTSPTRGQYDIPQGRIFKGKLLNGLDKATKTGLQLGDRPYYEGAYNDRLNQLMKINKVSEPTEDIINQATEYAKERTFQNDSNIAKGMKWIQEGLNKLTGNKDIGIGTFAVPFTKTPANILDKAISYSPVGYAKALNELRNIKPGTFNQKNFIDNIARGTTGTGLIMLGYDLASKGHLMGGTNKDKDVAALQKQTGASPYSIKVGKDYYTIDWAQPSAIPLMIGADIFHGGKDRKGAENIVIDAVKSGGETLFKQSLLQGVQKLFGGNTPLEGVTDVAKSIPSQFIPSVLKQGAQALDKNQRETYSTNTSGYVKNSITSKLPIVSKNMQPKVDTLGRNVETYQGKNNAFNILLNPGFKTTEKTTPGEKLALDIYNKSGLKTQFPRVAPKSIKGTPLTEQQFTDLQREMGKETLDMLNRLAKNVNIDNMTDKQIENLAERIESRLTKISSISKKKVLPKELLNKR